MIRQIVITAHDWERVKVHLLQNNKENKAFGLCGINQGADYTKILVKEVILVPKSALSAQSEAYVEVKDEFVTDILKRCRDEGLGLLDMHSHPFCKRPKFSGVDDDSDIEHFIFIADKLPQAPHGSLVFGKEGVDGRYWSRVEEEILPVHEVVIIGSPMEQIQTENNVTRQAMLNRMMKEGFLRPRANAVSWERLSRQVRVFGKEGQLRLSSLKVGIVGCGGTGSVAAIQLAYAGVMNMVLVDFDNVEETNRNRLLGATLADAERHAPKVEVLERVIRDIDRGIHVSALTNKADDNLPIRELKSCDVLFGCVDRDYARFFLNRLAAQYMIPYFDVSSGIVAGEEGKVEEFGGRVTTFLPGETPCMECLGLIDMSAVSIEQMSDAERHILEHQGYVMGDNIPAPSVLFLNSVIVSLAMAEILNLVAPFKQSKLYLIYEGMCSKVQSIQAQKKDGCLCCSEHSNLGMGDLVPLPNSNREQLDLPTEEQVEVVMSGSIQQ